MTEFVRKRLIFMAAVSIIIPVYNVEKYVDRCLNSIANQTFPDIEIILINDGSNDGSGEKCLAWAKRDNRIIYVSKKNEGRGFTRNLGIKMASAEFLAFCDSDDWYDEKYIELMLAKQQETDADIVICGHIRYDGDLERVAAWDINESLEGKLKNWAWDVLPMLWLKLFRKSLLIDHGIKMPHCFFEDLAINYPLLAKAKKIAVVEQALYFYYFNRPGSGANSHIQVVPDFVKFMDYCLDLFVRDNILEEYKKDLLDMMFRYIDYWFVKIGDDAEYAEKWLSDCLKVIKKYFGDMTGLFQKKICAIGSYSLFNSLPRHLPGRVSGQKAVDEHLFSGLISYMSGKAAASPMLDNPFRQAALDRDLSKTLIKNLSGMDYDYIMIDFLDERFDMAEANGGYYTISDAFMEAEIPFAYNTLKRDDVKMIELWEKKCLKFIALLRARFSADRIILVKNYLAERVGTSDRQTSYDRLGEIRRLNAIIGTCYKFFETNCPGIKIIDPRNNDMSYTYEKFRHGCDPWHYNQRYYFLIKEQISEYIAGL